MATDESVKIKIQNLITKANNVTGKTDIDLTSSINSLIEGYGQGEIAEEWDGSYTIA